MTSLVPSSSGHRGASPADVPDVIVAAQQAGYLRQDVIDDGGEATETAGGPAGRFALFYDLDAVDSTLAALQESFPPHFMHAIAVKTNPMSRSLRRVVSTGCGLECATYSEVLHSLKMGCDPAKVIYDSPCKTWDEIRGALRRGVQINCNELDEVERIAKVVARDYPGGELPGTAAVGIRINPLLGSGSIEALSVSNPHSKFGVPLTDANRARVMGLFAEHAWITGLHAHVGSQGCGPKMLATGAKVIFELAEAIEAQHKEKAAAAVGSRHHRVTWLDIGGGLPTNFDSEDTAPTFAEYAGVLREVCPGIMADSCARRIVTEFGRAVWAKPGWVASQVEYVKQCDDGHNIALIHAGSDLFMRTCYCPEGFPLRVTSHDAAGQPLLRQDAKREERASGAAGAKKEDDQEEDDGQEDDGQEDDEEKRPVLSYDVAGPLCFGGDKVLRNANLPHLRAGDMVVIHDAGANCYSLWSRHCSRPAPAVIGYSRKAADGPVQLTLIRAADNVRDTLAFWD